MNEKKNCTVKMPSRKDCLNLTKELNHYLTKKESEIRKKLKDGPPSLDDSISKPASKSLVSIIFGNIYRMICSKFDQTFRSFFTVAAHGTYGPLRI